MAEFRFRKPAKRQEIVKALAYLGEIGSLKTIMSGKHLAGFDGSEEQIEALTRHATVAAPVKKERAAKKAKKK